MSTADLWERIRTFHARVPLHQWGWILLLSGVVLTLVDIVRLFVLPQSYQVAFTDSYETVIVLLGALACGFAARRSSGLARALWAMTAAYLAVTVAADFHDFLVDLHVGWATLLSTLEFLGWCGYLPITLLIFLPALEEGRLRWKWLPAIDFVQAAIAVALAYFRFIYLHHVYAGQNWTVFGRAELVRNVLISAGLLLRAAVEPSRRGRIIYRVVGGAFATITLLKGVVPAWAVIGRPAALLAIGIFAAYWSQPDQSDDAVGRSPQSRLHVALDVCATATLIVVLLLAYDTPAQYRAVIYPIAAISALLFILRSSVADHVRHVIENELRSSGEELRASEDRYRDLVEHSEDLACTHDLGGNLLSVNPAPARILGYEVAELLKIPLRELIAPEFREQFDAYLQRIRTSGADKGLMCVITRGGERRIWEYSNTLRTEGVASPIVRGMAHDVTERQRAEAALRRSEQRYRMLFEKSIAGVALTSLEGEILDCNDTWAHMVGYASPAELRGQPIQERYARTGVREAVVDELRRTGGLSNWEVEFRRKDGTQIWVLSNATLIEGKSGPVIQSTIVDITAQKEAEEALRRREQDYRTLLENIPDLIVRYDKDLRRIFVNPAWERTSGLSAKDMIGVPITDVDWAGSDKYLEKLRYVIETGTPQTVELSWTDAQGAERFHRCIFVSEFDRSGNIVGVLAVGHDNTVLKQAERERAANLHFFESTDKVNRAILRTDDLQQMMNDVLDEVLSIFDCDRAFLLYPCDPEAKAFTSAIERTRPEYPGFPATTGFMPIDEEVAQTLRVVLGSEGPMRANPGGFPLPSAAAKQFNVQSAMSMALYPKTGMPWQFGIHSCSRPRVWTDEETKLLDAIGRRLTDALTSFLAHRDLQESEGKLAEAQRIAHVGYWDYDMDADRYLWSAETYRIFGLSPDEHMLNRSRIQQLIPAEDWGIAERAFAEVLGGGPNYEAEHRVVRPNGEVRFIHAHGNVMRDKSGRAHRMFGTVQDITERKQAEDALRQSDERFRVALKDSPITVFNQDRDLRYMWIYNPCFVSAAEVIGKTDDEVIGKAEAEQLNEVKRRVLKTGRAERTEVAVWYEGKKRPYEVTVEALLDSGHKIIGITGTYVDVARLRELADGLKEAKDRLAQEKQYLESEIESELGFEKVIGQSPALRDVLKNARVVAPTDSTVLLLGETGTGKELVARSVHALSSRRERSFIKLNCAAVPTGLLESELFGHEKGAFTGAVSQKVGRLELADKGTLFLDEIGELPLELQPKLLRVLQDQEFERLGGVRTLRVDVRIISATNRDLRKEVADKKFREDLYYRLNVFPISLPPLRERRSDIPALVRHFVEKHATRMGKRIANIPHETMSALESWSWPGNIRELENMVERMVILTRGGVLAPPPMELDVPNDLAGDNLTEMEREHIIRVLQETNGVLSGASGAASRLGVKRTTLQSMLKRFGIEPHEFRRGSGTFGRE
jgi:PAS domain S-box-containing protein